MRHRASTAELAEARPEAQPRKSLHTKARLLAHPQNASDEIENLILHLADELKKINIEKGATKASSPELFVTVQEPKSNYLASSALKNLQTKKDRMVFLKSSLNGALKKTK